jgi:hypothetical protein
MGKPSIRVFVFRDRPDTLLIHVGQDYRGPFSLPEIQAPFVREDIAFDLGRAGIRAGVFASVPGRWTQVMSKARSDDRAARRQQQTQREATQAALFRGASDPEVRERGAAVTRKLAVDEEIRGLKKQIAEAKTAAATRGVYMPPHEFRGLEARLEEAKQESQALQTRLGELKAAEKDRNRAIRDEETRRFERRFYEAAKAILDEDTLADILAEANGEDEVDDVA